MAQDVLQMNTELSQKQGLLLRIYMYIEVYGPRGQQSGQAGSDIQIQLDKTFDSIRLAASQVWPVQLMKLWKVFLSSVQPAITALAENR